MLIRPATPADIPAMMRLVNHSATAAHWSRAQYDRVFGDDAPRRLALVIEEEAMLAGISGRARNRAGVGNRKHRDCRGGAAARAWHPAAGRVSWIALAPKREPACFSRCGNPIMRRDCFTKSGHSRRAAGVPATTLSRKKMPSCTAYPLRKQPVGASTNCRVIGATSVTYGCDFAHASCENWIAAIFTLC